MNKKKEGVVVWRLMFFLSLFVIYAIFSETNRQDESKKSTKEESIQTSTINTRPAASGMNQFSSQELSDAYERNTVAADQQFKGKWILVYGKVSDINTSFSGDAYVVFENENRFHAPQAKFLSSESDKLIKLNKGQYIKLICVGDGDIVKSPMLRSCTFED